MITKAAFFAILNDENNKIGVTAHIAFVAHDNGTHALIIKQNGAPNTWLSNHKTYTTTTAAFHKYNDWINEWFTAQAEAAQARIDVLDAAHAEALEVDRTISDRWVSPVRAAAIVDSRRKEVEAAHEEALAEDAKFESALAFMIENITLPLWEGSSDNLKSLLLARGVSHPGINHQLEFYRMNKAAMKQQQTPLNLPKAQKVDVLRAALRGTPASQEQIDAIGQLTETECRKALATIINKGAKVTAHLVKSKRFGYGALTFGVNGQLPPGTYHAFTVTNMKNAREVASRYGALMWNF